MQLMQCLISYFHHSTWKGTHGFRHVNQTCLPGPIYGGVVVMEPEVIVRLVVGLVVVVLVVVVVGVGVVGGVYLRVVVVSSSKSDRSK